MFMKRIESFRQRFNAFGLVALAGFVIPLVMIVTEVLLIYFNVGYDPLIESISALGLKPLGWVQSISFLVIGLLIEVFTIGLYFAVRRKKGFGTGIFILSLCGFGLLLLGSFRTQPIGAPMTFESGLHLFTARTIFILFPISCFLIAFSLKSDANWHSLFVYTIVTGIITFILVLLWIQISTIYWFGLYERILVANEVIWLEVMSARLLILSFRSTAVSPAPEANT